MAIRDRFRNRRASLENLTRTYSHGYRVYFPIAYDSKFSDLAAFEVQRTGEVFMMKNEAEMGGQMRPFGSWNVLTSHNIARSFLTLSPDFETHRTRVGMTLRP